MSVCSTGIRPVPVHIRGHHEATGRAGVPSGGQTVGRADHSRVEGGSHCEWLIVSPLVDFSDKGQITSRSDFLHPRHLQIVPWENNVPYAECAFRKM